MQNMDPADPSVKHEIRNSDLTAPPLGGAPEPKVAAKIATFCGRVAI